MRGEEGLKSEEETNDVIFEVTKEGRVRLEDFLEVEEDDGNEARFHRRAGTVAQRLQERFDGLPEDLDVRPLGRDEFEGDASTLVQL